MSQAPAKIEAGRGRKGPRRRRSALELRAPDGTHIPVRTCAGCGERAARGELIRFTLIGSAVAPMRRLAIQSTIGRGAYLHRTESCRQRFAAGKPLIPGLRARIERQERERFLEELRASDVKHDVLVAN